MSDAVSDYLNQNCQGRHRPHWTFRRRDAGNDQPVLRRKGSTEPERTAIEFSFPTMVQG